MRIAAIAALVLGSFAVQDPKPPGPAPAAAPATAPVEAPKADPADVASIDAIVKALYDVISGPAGKARDWQRMRSLFHPDARLVPMIKGKDGPRAVLLKVEDYVARAGANLERDGFFEQEIARKTDEFGDLAQVFSTYAARHKLDDATPFLRGINSIQLVRQQGRWFVLQVLWEQEADAGPIPAQYLPAK
jgi:hypothetical protein